MLVTDGGQLIRMPGRPGAHHRPRRRMGVMLFRLDDGERVISLLPGRRTMTATTTRRRRTDARGERPEGSPMTERVGLYPGTFDPVTNGHLDVIGRAARLVDRLVVGVAINIGKGPLFALEERVELVQAETAPIAARTGTRDRGAALRGAADRTSRARSARG